MKKNLARKLQTVEPFEAVRRIFVFAKYMNDVQINNLFRTAEKIADHLVYAWNYCATLRRLQYFSKQCPEVFDANGHFISTIFYAMWDSLFLELSHCTDKRREAIGFPKFFKQLRSYLAEGHQFRKYINKHERLINELEPQKKISNWRNQVVGHYAIIDNVDIFYKANICSIDEIETLISDYNGILHVYSIPLLKHRFKVNDLGKLANRGIDKLIRGMKKETAQEKMQ